jgi:hypothetical protein
MTDLTATYGALARANELQQARADAKRRLRDGRLRLETALGLNCLQRMRVYDLLCCLPVRPGSAGTTAQARRPSRFADQLFAELGVKPLARVQDLTDRKRQLLVSLYEGRIPGACGQPTDLTANEPS